MSDLELRTGTTVPALPTIRASIGAGRRLACGATVLAALLGSACRSDSITTPIDGEPVGCTDAPGCRPSEREAVSPLVFAAVADAIERLVPMLDASAGRTALVRGLAALQAELQANRSAPARARLAEVYVELDRMRITVEGLGAVDLPDVAAIRLAMVPVANALGVKAST
jgi:hypothetical protein